MNVEQWLAVLGGAITVIFTLVGIIWNMVRKESEKQAEQLGRKAEVDQLREISASLRLEIDDVRDNSEKLVNKLEQRHDKELEQLAHRFGESMRVMEQNILTHIRLMVEVMSSDKTK